MTSCQHTAYYTKAWLVIVVLCFILYTLMHTEKMPRLSKQCSLINIRTVWKIFTSSGLHVHTVELVLIQGSNIYKPYFINVKQHNSSYLITYLKNYLTKPYTLSIFKPSTKYYKCCSISTRYPTALQTRKWKGWAIHQLYSRCSKKGLQQLESISLTKLPILRFILEIEENI